MFLPEYLPNGILDFHAFPSLLPRSFLTSVNGSGIHIVALAPKLVVFLDSCLSLLPAPAPFLIYQ